MDMIGARDSQWEYEYDEEETEDFYVVLELPPDASALKPKSKVDELFAPHDPTKPRKKAPRAGTKRRRAAVDEDEHDEEEALPRPPGQPVEDHETATAAAQQVNPLQDFESLKLAANASTALDKPSEDAAAKGLQIMDLESDDPMIMYQGQIYACQWASSIGSDLLFVRRPNEPGPGYNPLHSFEEVDLLGFAAAKLVASPATIQPRQDFARPSELDAAPPDGSVSVHDDDVVRQARFLGRIAEIKAARGEQVGNLKTLAESVYRSPENADPPVRRGRGGRGRGRGRSVGRPAGRRPRASKNEIASSTTPTVAGTRARRASTQSNTASTPTPTTWAELEGEDNAENDLEST